VQHWVCLQAEQALDAEVAIDVQDHGASPMEEDVLPEAACPEIFSTDMMLSLWYQNYPQKLAISASNNTVAHTSSQGVCLTAYGQLGC